MVFVIFIKRRINILGRPTINTILYSRNRTTTMYVQMLPWLHYGLSLCLVPYREVSTIRQVRLSEGPFLIGQLSIFTKKCSFYGLYELEVCRSPIYFKAVGFLESFCHLLLPFISFVWAGRHLSSTDWAL